MILALSIVIGNASLRVVPILGAIIGAAMANDRLRARIIQIVLRVADGTIGGVYLDRFLSEHLASDLKGFLWLVISPGTVLGGCIGNLGYTMKSNKSEDEDDHENHEFGAEDHPVWDRELDG